MKYEKGKKITDVNQFKKGRKYYVENEVFEFSHIGANGNPYFKDNGQPYFASESEYNCIGFDYTNLNFYEAVEVMKNLVGRKVKGFKFNHSFIGFDEAMNKYIGQVGEITDVDVSFLEAKVEFEDGVAWTYPLDKITEHLVPEWKIGKEYEFSDDGECWEEPMELVGIIDHEYKYLVETTFNGGFDGYKQIREIKPKVKELTLEEAEETLTAILGTVTKLKK